MLYKELIDTSIIEKLPQIQYISQERKDLIVKNLNTTIDERFSGFQHTILPSWRKHQNYEWLESIQYMDPFVIDQNKIINSKALRRLSDKAQVLPNVKEENSHMRNRLTHTLEVAELSGIFCDMMNHHFALHKLPIRLNKELCKAIALGHDIGHTPMGHIGEDFTTKKAGKKFNHNVFWTVVAEEIERKGNGLNLNKETLIGILNHTTNGGSLDLKNHPQEYAVVRIMDKVAYVLADPNDWRRQWYIDNNIVPLFKLGKDQRERSITILQCLVEETFENWYVTFWKSKIGEIFKNVKDILPNEYYDKVDKERSEIANTKLDIAYDFFKKERPDTDPAISLALLTDVEVIKMNKILKQNPNISYQELIKKYHIGLGEILPYIDGRNINWETPSLGEKKENKKSPLEIEKKFLVKNLPMKLESYPYADIIQWYISMNDSNEVRIRKTTKSDGTTTYTRTIKEDRGEGINEEIEKEISQEKFEYLFQFTNNQIVSKRRYYIPINEKLIAELDIFTNEDPIVEVEFPNTESKKRFIPPVRFGEEVTWNKYYKNSHRALRNTEK